jgi:DNA-binding CsgD family transcriptional regulator/N-acetylneuraminic acid mutarotase
VGDRLIITLMAEPGEQLSERELDVLQCVVNGASNKEIAVDLTISQNTVKVHLRNIFTKLGVSSRTEATAVALQQGLATLPGVEMVEVNGDNTAVSPPPDESPSPALPVPLSEETTAVHPVPLSDPLSEPQPASQPMSRARPTAVIVVGLLLLLLVAVAALSWQTFASPAATATAVPTALPFQEAPIGDTRWAEARPMAAARAHMATAAIGLDVFQIGGEAAAGVVGDVLRYNTIEHRWEAMAAKPTAVADASAAVLFGEIYVPGGRLADGSPTDVVEAYSPANNAWRPVAALPQPIAGGLALSDGSFLYLLGGWDGTDSLSTAYVYDPGNDSWRPLAALPAAKAFAAGGFVAGRLYVVGGMDNGRAALDTCHVFDITSATWADCPPMLTPRTGSGAAVLFNKLYIIGGANDAGDISFSEYYDPNTATWQVVNTPMLEDAPQWANLGVTNVETRIYALGGRRNGELQTAVFVYSPVVYQTFIPAASASGDATAEP